MKLLELAGEVFDRAEKLKIPHMVVGAIAAGAHGTTQRLETNIESLPPL